VTGELVGWEERPLFELPPVAVSRPTLAEREARIDAAQTAVRESFATMGVELAAIRDDELYRAEYLTFDAYCRERWGFTRQRGYELIRAAEAVTGVRNFLTPVVTDSQARQLGRLPIEDRGDAWNTAVEDTKRTGEARKLGPTIDELRAEVDRRVDRGADLRMPPAPPRRDPHRLILVLRLNRELLAKTAPGDIHEDDRAELAELATAWADDLKRLTGGMSP
jgi:hypothetical protein